MLTVGCNNRATDNTSSNIDSSGVEQNGQSETFIFNEYQSDSVTIDLKSDHDTFTVLLNIGGYHKEYDLKALNIPTKTPELYWINKNYACMVTWYSQAQSRHIFIPIKHTNEFIYIDKDIEEMDSINNNIVYIDTVTQNPNKVVYTVENLLTRKNKSLTFRVGRHNGNYPFYDNIILTKNRLTILTASEKKSIDINEINNGL